MKFVIEVAGPVLDVRPAYWAAYSTAVAKCGLAKTDQETFWRLVRTGASFGQMIRGAKPRQVLTFEANYKEALGSAECISLCEPQGDVSTALVKLGRSNERAAVIVGGNGPDWQNCLQSNHLDGLFFELKSLTGSPSDRVRRLNDLASDNDRVMLIAGSATMAGVGSSADVFVVGVSNGVSTPQKLTNAGAAVVVADLSELVVMLERGGGDLAARGFVVRG